MIQKIIDMALPHIIKQGFSTIMLIIACAIFWKKTEKQNEQINILQIQMLSYFETDRKELVQILQKTNETLDANRKILERVEFRLK